MSATLFDDNLDPTAAASADPTPPGDGHVWGDPGDDVDYVSAEDQAAWEEYAAIAAEADAAPERALDEVSPLPGPAELVEGLNPRQRDAVEAGDGPLLVVAGPGSGKTRVLTHRIALLLRRGMRPWEVLAVTFTNKAAAEMRERLEGLVGHGAVESMWVSTFHSACVRLLRREHQGAGLTRNFTIVDADDAERLVRRILKDLSFVADDKEARSLAPQLRDLISSAKNNLETPDAMELRTRTHGAAAVMVEYDRRLAAMGGLDFDDLLVRALWLLRDNAEVRERYQQRFRHVLVDEFQDTNKVQYALTRLLSGGADSLTVVGDLDQCIYSWRGARRETLEEFSGDHPDAKVIVLDQNYRSSKAILEVCQAVIDPNPGKHRANLWTKNDEGAPVDARECDDDRDEARWVVDRIMRMHRPWSDHAILVRTNAQTRVLEEALTSDRVPYRLIGTTKFYERQEIRDALAWCKLVVNPADTTAFERASGAPRRGLGDKSVAGVLTHAHTDGVDVVAALRDLSQTGSGRATSAIRGFVDAYDAVSSAAAGGPIDAVRAVLEDAGLRGFYAAQPDSDARVENLDELVNAAAEFVSPDRRTADGERVAAMVGFDQTVAFLEHVALVSAADEAGDDQVQVLTVHAAKGREFPVVHVVGLEEKIFPHARSLDDEADLEEERRLLFVACSRAMERLALSWARTRYLYGQPTDLPPSRFLADLPDSVQRDSAPRRRRSPEPGWGNRSGAGRWGHVTRPQGAAARRPPRQAPATPAPKPFSAPGGRLSPSEVAPGVRVRHSVFGDGVVTSLSGKDATVQFPGGFKTLSLDFAPLELAP